MNPNHNSSSECFAIVNHLRNLTYSNKELSHYHLSLHDIGQLGAGCAAERNEETGDMYSRPMFWIGIYTAIASFLCVLAMAADWFHAALNRKSWIPCKYFTLNAASITVIAVAMKLPVDLTTPMPGYKDQAAKLVSLAFMSVIMMNLMPSLASMDNKTLVANVIGLSILAITVCVNTYIQINSNLISHTTGMPNDFSYDCNVVAYIYTGFILGVLLITISFSLAIPGLKEIIDSKYQVKNKYLTNDQRMQPIEHVRRYWVMAETGSPQFVMTYNLLSVTFGVVCVALINTGLLGVSSHLFRRMQPQSPYKWSTLAIFITQCVGVFVGSCSPISRMYGIREYKSGSRIFFNIFRVEGYWTKKLHEWKQHRILFLSSSPRSRRLIHNSKDIILTLCILLQSVVVFLSKMILLILVPFLVARRWKSLNETTPPITSTPDSIDPDLNTYVLNVDDELEIVDKTRKYIFKSVNSYISKAEKEQNKSLLELIEQSTEFEGVKTFDTNQVQPLEVVNTWSLPLVTLTCIAVALPNIPKDKVKNLFESVNEGLSYTHLVEESFNCGNKYAKLQKISMALWLEVDNKGKWLGIPLEKDIFTGKTAIEIAKWFSDRAKEILTDNMSTNQVPFENMDNRMIAADSMYRITETIFHRFQSTEVTKRQLFAHLRGMIADIFSACFTNIPWVIKMKCSESVIEKREESVKAAAKLLGKTTEIRKMLEARPVPLMDIDKMAYIDEWRNLSVP